MARTVPDTRQTGYRSYRDRVALIVLALVITMGVLQKYGPDRWPMDQFLIGLAVVVVASAVILAFPPLRRGSAVRTDGS